MENKEEEKGMKVRKPRKEKGGRRHSRQGMEEETGGRKRGREGKHGEEAKERERNGSKGKG